jgi:hypothetical protein
LAFRRRLLAAGVVFCLAGGLACGSGVQTLPSSGSCLALAGYTVGWQENGVVHCGITTIDETSTPNGVFSTRDLFSVIGTDNGGNTFNLLVNSLVPGTYSCGSDAGVSTSFLYWPRTDTGYPEIAQTCSITITSVGRSGANAAGTFSATFAPADGGTVEITNGTFDGPVS